MNPRYVTHCDFWERVFLAYIAQSELERSPEPVWRAAEFADMALVEWLKRWDQEALKKPSAEQSGPSGSVAPEKG